MRIRERRCAPGGIWERLLAALRFSRVCQDEVGERCTERRGFAFTTVENNFRGASSDLPRAFLRRLAEVDAGAALDVAFPCAVRLSSSAELGKKGRFNTRFRSQFICGKRRTHGYAQDSPQINVSRSYPDEISPAKRIRDREFENCSRTKSLVWAGETH